MRVLGINLLAPVLLLAASASAAAQSATAQEHVASPLKSSEDQYIIRIPPSGLGSTETAPAARPAPSPRPTISHQRGFNVDYATLARDPTKYKGYTVYMQGKVVQVIDTGYTTALRVNVTPGSFGTWNDTVFVEYRRQPNAQRVLENDIVSFSGEFVGLQTYRAVLGQTITIPHVIARRIDTRGQTRR